MRLQYLSDTNGNHTGVFIPITDWEELIKQYNISVQQVSESNLLEKELKQAVKEVSMAKKGLLKARPARELIDELKNNA